MEFVRSYFGTNEPLTSQKVRKKCSTGQRFICTEVEVSPSLYTEVTSYKIHILVYVDYYEIVH